MSRRAMDVTRLSVAGRDRWSVWVRLGGERGSVASEGEAMSQQSMRKAALLAASDTQPSRTHRSDGLSRAVPIEVQDHHAVEGYAERLLVARRMSTGPSGDCGIPFFPVDSDVLRPSRGGFAVPSLGRRRPAPQP
jgi:hypothetical protein